MKKIFVILGSLMLPLATFAASADITQINFTTSPQTLEVNTVSASLTVQTQNVGGTSEQTSETNHLNLVSSSLTGEFSSSATDWISVNELTMNTGSANRTFYYKDSTPGTHTLTITANGQTWTAASQNIIINAPALPTPTPSTNSANKTNSWAYVEQVSKGVGTTDLQFVSTRAFYSCFEYRTDGDTSQVITENGGNNYNTLITDGLYPYYCQNNNNSTHTITANEYVEVRMVFGAESDERFDWTRFDVLPGPALSAQDFGVMDLSGVKGYSAGFGLSNATLKDVKSMVVKLYAGDALLQTDASTGKLQTDYPDSTQFSSPFDVLGSFDYGGDGYWDNARESEYGKNVTSTKVVATVTLNNDQVLTAENTNLTGDTTTIVPPGSLAAEDFGVVNYDVGSGLGVLKGYTAGFGVKDATLEGAQSVEVKLYSGETLLQTNTAIISKFNADIKGAQFSSPFDVFGTFDYVADGYWTNVKAGSEFGQTLTPNKVEAAVTLASGKVVTAQNINLTGDTSVFPEVLPKTGDKELCKNDGWKDLVREDASPFNNQGDCVSYIESNQGGNSNGNNPNNGGGGLSGTHRRSGGGGSGQVLGASTSIYGDESDITDLQRQILALMAQLLNLLQSSLA